MRYLCIILLFFSCGHENQRNLKINISGLYTSPEIGLSSSSEESQDMYLAIELKNNTADSIKIFTTDNEKFFSPSYIQYFYLDKARNIRKRGGGATDFFSAEETIIPPKRSMEFYFYAHFPEQSDTVEFTFKFLRADSICFLQTTHLISPMKKVENLFISNLQCD